MHIRKKRPTLKDAHDYIERGHYTVEENDYISNEERGLEAESVRKVLVNISKRIPRTRNLEYMILKCHLITEYVLTQYICFMSEPLIAAVDIRFGYSQKLDIAHMMGFGIADPLLIPSLNLLNKARNQVAHSFELDQSIINEIIRINSDDPKNFETPSLTDQIRGIRAITICVCAFTAGYIIGRTSVESNYKLQIH